MNFKTNFTGDEAIIAEECARIIQARYQAILGNGGPENSVYSRSMIVEQTDNGVRMSLSYPTDDNRASNAACLVLGELKGAALAKSRTKDWSERDYWKFPANLKDWEYLSVPFENLLSIGRALNSMGFDIDLSPLGERTAASVG